MFDFTGSEKSFIAMGNVILPLTVLIGALLAWAGLGEMPEPVQIRDAITYFIIAVGVARGVWQVPNTGTVPATKAEIEAIKENTATHTAELKEANKSVEENPS